MGEKELNDLREYSEFLEEYAKNKNHNIFLNSIDGGYRMALLTTMYNHTESIVRIYCKSISDILNLTDYPSLNKPHIESFRNLVNSFKMILILCDTPAYDTDNYVYNPIYDIIINRENVSCCKISEDDKEWLKKEFSGEIKVDNEIYTIKTRDNYFSIFDDDKYVFTDDLDNYHSFGSFNSKEISKHLIEKFYHIFKRSERINDDIDFDVKYYNFLRDTDYLSNTKRIMEDFNFQRIVEMGTKATPFIMRKIKDDPSYIVWALNLIYNRKISDDDMNIIQACKLWVEEYEKKPYNF